MSGKIPEMYMPESTLFEKNKLFAFRFSFDSSLADFRTENLSLYEPKSKQNDFEKLII